MDLEPANHARDDSRCRGSVGPKSERKGSEEGEELAHHHVEKGSVSIVEVEIDVAAASREDGPRPHLFVRELLQQVSFVGAMRFRAREKAHEECRLPERAHGTVPQAEEGLGEGGDATVRHLQHLERGFPSGPVPRAASQVNGAREVAASRLRERGGVLSENRFRAA